MDNKQNNKPTVNKVVEDKVKNKYEMECVELKKQVEEYKNKYLRALADYQNFEKRVSLEKDGIRASANRQLIIKLLNFLDGLDKAEEFITDKNLKLIKDNYLKLLKDEGLEEVEILGKEYDPYVAEVIEIVKGEKDNIVIEVLRKGYKLNGQLIRVAQVRVSKKS